MTPHSKPPRPTIGWREWVSLPELGIKDIKVKVDTGARSSAIHASNVHVYQRAGRYFVGFDVHPVQRDSRTVVHVHAPLLDQRAVKNSGGRAEKRLVIHTLLRFMGAEWPIELTLTDRDAMGFRMLLGRQAIRGRYAVDPGRSYVGGKPLRLKRKKKSGKKKTKNRNRLGTKEA